MPFYYRSGEEILKGDRVLFAERYAGEIEFVADPSSDDPTTSWYVKELGGGVMIREPEVHGWVFESMPDEDSELAFVSRGNSTQS